MRLHGDREPKQRQHGTTGGATCLSGAPNEMWSYGPEVYGICKKYMLIREELRSYTRKLMREGGAREGNAGDEDALLRVPKGEKVLGSGFHPVHARRRVSLLSHARARCEDDGSVFPDAARWRRVGQLW